MDDPNFYLALLQTVSTGLILASLWFARTLWSRLKEMEIQQNMHRLELERSIAELRLDTSTRLVALENHGER
tara:strand:+ start:1317 stop:1532 length:216 start_codon:yes stop_codon:yes gene_type:complete